MARGGLITFAVAAAAGALLASSAARADDPDFLSVAGGYFDWNRTKNTAVEFRGEYRSDANTVLTRSSGSSSPSVG